MDNIIAFPHWNACESCKQFESVPNKPEGCRLPSIDLKTDPILDAIICLDYKGKEVE